MSTFAGRAGFAPALALNLALGLALVACAPTPPKDAAAIESVGILARQGRQAPALRQLQDWANQGHAVAQRELALALLADPAQRDEGLAWLGRAAQGGDAEAGYQLGEAHRLGRFGLAPDVRAAKPWMALAAKAGHPDAALNMARMASNGEAGPQDPVQALFWLKLASAQGNAQAMMLLSSAYALGRGTAVDQAQARHWLEQAADRHFPAAIQAYALALENGELGLEKNPDEARELLAEAREERRNRWNMR